MTDFIPRPYQREIIAHQLAHARCAVYAGMGMGKTSSTYVALDALELVCPGPALVLAPYRVATSTWPDEAAKWSNIKLEVSAVCGTPAQRKRALARDAQVFTTNYEQIPWLVEHFGSRWPFRKIIADESTRLKGFRMRQGTKRARALSQVAHAHCDHFIELSGTPSPNGLQDLWGQVHFLDRGQRLGKSFKGFLTRWFRPVRVGADPHAVQWVPLPHAQKEIQDLISDICLSVRAEDHFDIAEPIVNVVRVELPDKARAYYDDMEREMFVELGECDVEALNAAARTQKCLQIANGAIYTDDGYAEVHDAKLQALDSIVSEAAGMPVLVAYHFKSDLERLLRAFPKGRHLDKDPQTVRDWNAGKIPVLFAHPASAGHGLNLAEGGNILAMFGHWWDLEHYLQIIERIGPTRQAQAGLDRPVFIHQIVATDTVDELVMARRQSKRRVQDILLEAVRRRAA